MSMKINVSESQVDETTFKQAVDTFLDYAPEGGWNDYWAMQLDWEAFVDGLVSDGTVTDRQAGNWSNPCTPETFNSWQKRNGLTRRPRAWDETKKSEEVINNLTSPEAKKIYADVHKNHWKKPKFAELMDRCVADEDCGDLIDYLMGVYGTDIRDTLSEDDELLRLGFTLVDDWREEHGTNESRKKSEATKFGAGMATRKDFSKTKNLGEIFDVLDEHLKSLKAASEDMSKSKEDLEASIKKLQEFEGYTDFLKQQSVKGIKKALTLKNSPEVQAASEIEKNLKDALSVIMSDYKNVTDVTQLMVVIDSKYATRGSKILTTLEGQVSRAIDVDMKTIKDSIDSGDITEDDVMKLVTMTSVSKGMKNKDTATKVKPVLERMNAMLESASKVEEAIIDPQQFKELRDLVEQIVNEASTPKETIKTTVTALDKETIASVPEAKDGGLLGKLKEFVKAIKDKIAGLWDSFTSLFFSIEDEALEASDVFDEVEAQLGEEGIAVEGSTQNKEETLSKKFEVLTKSVLTCCDNLVKDSALAGEFDDEVIYAEEAVKNAVESFQNLGEACKSLKASLSYHKNEDNNNVIGILAGAIMQIVADEEGAVEGEESSDAEDNAQSMIDRVEREYSAPGGEQEEPERGGEEEPERGGVEGSDEF